MSTTYTERAELYKKEAALETDSVKKAELLVKAECCEKLAKEPVLIGVGEPCGWCGSVFGRSNDEGRGDGWHRCLNCQGN